MITMDADDFPRSDISQDLERRKRCFEYLRERWRNARPQPNGLKPFPDLWEDVLAQRQGSDAPNEDDFWRQVVRSIREGFFDEERELFSVTDRKTRITSGSGAVRETLRWNNDDWWLLRAFVRGSWASIETLSAWAWHQRYEPPRAWQAVLAEESSQQTLQKKDLESRASSNIKIASPPRTTSKSQATALDIKTCVENNKRQDGEQFTQYHLRISDLLKIKGVQASPRLVRFHREKLDQAGRNGRNDK